MRPASSERLSVSATGTARIPPTSSSPTFSISRARSSRARHGRAASCTSTQSSGSTTFAIAINPFSTLSRRVAPPHQSGARRSWKALQSCVAQRSSSGASTTNASSTAGCASSAAAACATIGSARELEVLLGRFAAKTRALPCGGNQSDAACHHEITGIALISARIIATGRVGADAAKRPFQRGRLLDAGCFCRGCCARGSHRRSVRHPDPLRQARRLVRRARARTPGGTAPTACGRLRVRARGAAPARRDRVVRARLSASRSCPTGRRCPTTASRRTTTWSRSGWRRSTASPPATATSRSCRRRPPCSGSRRRPTSPATRSSSSRAPASTRRAARPARDRRLQPRDPGRRAGRVLHPRRPDRSLSDGQRAALPHRPRRRRDRVAPHVRRRHPAHGLQGERGAPAAGARVPARRRGARAASAPGSARRSRATRRSRRSTRTSRTASPRRESSTTCRSSSTDRHALRLPAAGDDARHPPRRARRDRRVLARRAVALPPAATATGRARCCRPADLFLSAEEFFVAAKAFERLDLQAPQLARDDADGSPPTPLPPVAVERRAADPLQALKRFLAATPARVLLVAESPGRRETMADYLAQYGVQPQPCASFAEFSAGDDRLMLGVAPLAARVSRSQPARPGTRGLTAGFAIVTETELYAGTARARGRRDQAKRSSIEGMLRDLSELDDRRSGRARDARHRPLPRPAEPRPRRGRHRVPAARVRRRRQALRAGRAAPHDRALLRRPAGAGAAPQARRRRVGQGEAQGRAPGARHRGRAARALCAARGAPGPQVRGQAARSRRVRGGLRLRGNAGPGGGDRGGGVRHARTASRWTAWSAATSASARPRSRCARPSSRSPTASRSRCSRRRRCSPSSTSSTFTDRFAGWPIRIAELSRFRTGGEQAEALQGARRGPRRHRDRHPQAALARREVQAPRAGHRRRGAPLRRAPEGTPEAAPRGGRRADADRDADPAHAGDVARGPARPVGDRDRAGAAARDQDLRHPALARHHPRSGAARAEARRPDLLPAQRRGVDRAREADAARRSSCPRRGSRSRTARCASASSSA